MIIRNNFHSTAVRINLRGARSLSARQVRRARQALCQWIACPCLGGVVHERGPQVLGRERVVFVLCPCGTVRIEEETQHPGEKLSD